MKTDSEIQILHFDKEVLAVVKPVGVSIHNQEDPTNLLVLLGKQLGVATLFPVHRLDKETSGIQIFARDEKTARELATEFQTRQVEKTYCGVLRGQLENEAGTWNQPLSDKAEGRRSPAGEAKNRIPCETQYRVLKSSRYFTHCEFNLITGRQHQIRKHTALARHALVGDPRYGDLPYNKKIALLYQTERMFLHCERIKIKGQTFSSPAPEEFHQLLTPQLRSLN